MFVTLGGKRFLIDPFFAAKGSTPPIFSPYNNSPNPLVALPLSIQELVAVDAVIVTHMHHFDKAARDAIHKDKPMFTQNEDEAEDMYQLGYQNVTALKDSGVPCGELTLFRTDAAHGLGEASDNNYKAFGIPADASGVVFKHPEEKTLYIVGDTVWCAGVKGAIDLSSTSLRANSASSAVEEA